MLNSKTIAIIKSTVPVLEIHGEKITTRFYKLMFQNHPELLNIFNHINQKKGRQQAALANVVYAAALHIDQLENIIPVVKQIAHKHRSLGVKAEHYPIVGEHLLLAIKDVLGEAATDEILQAWGEAYGVIADAFISIEKEMYEEAEQQQGGWKDFRHFIVSKKVKESSLITSFYLKSEDGQPIPSFLPGQYVSVRVQIAGEDYTHIRQYSLSDAAGKDYYRISVKRENEKDKPNGIVSNYLHEKIQEGDTLELSAPAGDFVLDTTTERPVVLISGGVGLTPMMSMLLTAVQQHPKREVTFIHATMNSETHALHDQVEQVSTENPNVKSYVCYQSPTESDYEQQKFQKEGFIDLAWLQSIIQHKEADFYFCGPVPFMKVINESLKEWGITDNQIHYEFFGPAMKL
ncbi:NO-inducible flavohemoprotein [Alkalihalobacillus sp. 1P02AB]|uniref:NO-inducible flavohemoprotein n=1 Tax=Alkalihalobacillus sp. 1P02AB TaxID=3132260 RepID=UPI0039A471F0